MEPIVHVMSKNGMFLFRFNNGENTLDWYVKNTKFNNPVNVFNIH